MKILLICSSENIEEQRSGLTKTLLFQLLSTASILVTDFLLSAWMGNEWLNALIWKWIWDAQVDEKGWVYCLYWTAQGSHALPFQTIWKVSENCHLVRKGLFKISRIPLTNGWSIAVELRRYAREIQSARIVYPNHKKREFRTHGAGYLNEV